MTQRNLYDFQSFLPVTVDYDRTLDQRINSGNYSYVDHEFTAGLYPFVDKITPTGQAELCFSLVGFNNTTLTLDEVVKELEKIGMRPANLTELQAFGEEYPEEQKQYLVTALGSVMENTMKDQGVPFLSGSIQSGHGQHNHTLRISWHTSYHLGYRFLVVPKTTWFFEPPPPDTCVSGGFYFLKT